MGTAVPSTHFSTRNLPAIDRFDAWRDMISVIFDVDRIGGPSCTAFEASVDAYQIGHLVITDSIQGEQSYSLSPKRSRKSGIDLFQIGVYRSGGYRGEADGSSIDGGHGDVQVLDLGKPMRSVEVASDMVCVFVPREILQDRIGDLDALHGADLRPGMGRLLGDYLGLLAKSLRQMPSEEGDGAATATIDMIAACLRPKTDTISDARSSIRNVMLLRAKQVIEVNLRSAHLTPDFLCTAIGVSRRSLYRLFEPLDGVHQYILQRRLTHIMRALSDPDNRRRIVDLATDHGFTCHETFWRAFKRQYHVTPGDVRSLHALNSIELPTPTGADLSQWLKELHA